jgi:RNA polymerase sigma-70 factor (ECF subfamily)
MFLVHDKPRVNDDDNLIERTLADPPRGFGPIIERYKDAVFGVSLARLRNFHDAEDVTQQVFLEAFERLGALKDHDRLGAWLRSIAIHQSINHLKRKRRSVDWESVDEPEDTGPSPEAYTERRELRRQLLGAIGELSKV